MIFLLILIAGAAWAQDFNVQSRLVLVPVTVTDGKGRTVEDLEADDFTVLDNGKPQKAIVDTFATGVAPIALIVAVQSSGISRPALEKVQKIGAMIHPLVTGDRGCAGLLAFDSRIRWLQECTKDAAALSLAFEKLQSGDARAGRMLDAVDAAVGRLRNHPKTRRVLVLISETRDRGSEAEMDAVMKEAQSAGVTIYSVTYSAFVTAWTTKSSATADPKPKIIRRPQDVHGTIDGRAPSQSNPPVAAAEQRVDLAGVFGEIGRAGTPKTTEALAKGTGGRTFSFARLKGLEEAVVKLGEELHSQYLLSFVPNTESPGFHTLDVRVRKQGAIVRARPGYWSVQP